MTEKQHAFTKLITFVVCLLATVLVSQYIRARNNHTAQAGEIVRVNITVGSTKLVQTNRLLRLTNGTLVLQTPVYIKAGTHNTASFNFSPRLPKGAKYELTVESDNALHSYQNKRR